MQWSWYSGQLHALEKEYTKIISTETKIPNENSEKLEYWSILYAIESHQGLNLYRPKNSSRNCKLTAFACGHHQLSLQALQDIGCSSIRCKTNRENYAISLLMSKKLETINLVRLKKSGINSLPDYQRYLLHQQGANGLKRIIYASKGRMKLSKSTKRNMASNSPYSIHRLNKMTNQQAAQVFLKHWKNKWSNQKEMITIAKLDVVNLPAFTQMDLDVALNLRY